MTDQTKDLKGLEIIEVGAGLVVNSDEEFLFVMASIGAGKGIWNNPGGRRNLEGQNETIEQCALREIEEECGLKPSRLEGLVATFHFRPSKSLMINKYVYLVTDYLGNEKSQEEEIEAVGWFNLTEIESHPEKFTEGAYLSAKLYLAKTFGGEYDTDRIA